MKKDAFNCPYCNAYANQTWSSIYANISGTFHDRAGFSLSICFRCKKSAIWYEDKMVYPNSSSAPLPNSDMPEDIKKDYNEARNLINLSPRSACVLLRLCIEKICDEQKVTGRDLNEKIGKLVELGLDPKIQKALDSVRVIGGQAVHPLEMDLKDDTSTATSLFKLVNYISEWAHTRPKTIDTIFESLPDGKKKAIEQRDT
ncbi:MAG: DUF4145 domain-containing protein [Thaumarchaeota archaeon]|nr:DUF4145 domain-containing protein [Nitrososphaerota archaeon]